MDEIQRNLGKILKKAVEQLSESKLPSDLVHQFDVLAASVDQPCIVAIVGQLKAGKSSLINALLEVDLAPVGMTGTTAIISYFRYGTPNTQQPVRCYWRNGHIDYVDQTFVNSLQGSDPETLRRSEAIDHLEYSLPNVYLEQVTLVDTPGLGTVSAKNQDRTDDFLDLRQLRERHSQETLHLSNQADAVIYLLGPMAQENDRDFLEGFSLITQGQTRAFNSVGVISKVDLNPEVVSRRWELAEKIANQLKESLNTVVPVSAGVRRTVDRLMENDRKGLRRLIEAIRRIPPEHLNKLLDNYEFYTELEVLDCPVTIDERKELLGEMQWTVFKTIASVAAKRNLDIDIVLEHLNALAGFDQLKTVLEQHIFRRSRLLRCYRILHDTRPLLARIKYSYLPQLRKLDILNDTRQESDSHEINLEPGGSIGKHQTRVDRVEMILEELERDFSQINYELEQYNADIQALQQVAEYHDLFSAAEMDELQALLGLYGLATKRRLSSDRISIDYVIARQAIWRRISIFDENPIRRNVAQQALARYGFILEEISEVGVE